MRDVFENMGIVCRTTVQLLLLFTIIVVSDRVNGKLTFQVFNLTQHGLSKIKLSKSHGRFACFGAGKIGNRALDGIVVKLPVQPYLL